MCFPQCLLCDVSSRMGEGCCFPFCCPMALAGLRVKLRTQENIQVGTRKSLLVHDFPSGKDWFQYTSELVPSNFYSLRIFMNFI